MSDYLAAAGLRIQHLTPAIGSEIHGLDLSRPILPTLLPALQDFVEERGAVFFPDQHLSAPQQRAVAEQFGEIAFPGGNQSLSPDPDMVVFNSLEGGRVPRWHTDVSSLPAPPAIQVIQMKSGPNVGGDTLFVSGEFAYARLSQPLQRFFDPLSAIHASTPLDALQHRQQQGQWHAHPIVRIHPHSGRPSLFVNPRFTTEIVGFSVEESDALLALLFEHLLRPEHFVRYRWSEGTIGIWDNRSTLHYAVDDYAEQLRITHRIGTGGEPPRGWPVA